MTTRTADLIAACDRGDEVRIEQLGWRPVMDALRLWPKRLDGELLAPYALLLADEPVQGIVDALRDLAGVSHYRPSPSQILQHLHPVADTVPRDMPDPGPAVRAALDAGEIPCECVPRPIAPWVDRHGVIRCPHCDGLEPGQVDRVRDTPPEPVRLARRDLQRLAAEVQNERIMEGQGRSPLLDRLAGGTDTPWHIFKPLPPITEADRQREREILGWPEP